MSTRHLRLRFFLLPLAGLALAGAGFLYEQEPAIYITDTPIRSQGTTRSPWQAPGVGDSAQESSRQSSALTRPSPLFPDRTPTVAPADLAAWLEAFHELRESSLEAFRHRVRQALQGEYSLAQQQAALEAWKRWAPEDRWGPYRDLLLARPTPDQVPTAQRQELLTSIVETLGRQAVTQGEPREILATALRSGTCLPSLRPRSWTATLRWGQTQEIQALLPTLYAESAPASIEAAGKALRRTRASGAGLILEELSKRHPRAAARRQFRRLLHPHD